MESLPNQPGNVARNDLSVSHLSAAFLLTLLTLSSFFISLADVDPSALAEYYGSSNPLLMMVGALQLSMQYSVWETLFLLPLCIILFYFFLEKHRSISRKRTFVVLALLLTTFSVVGRIITTGAISFSAYQVCKYVFVYSATLLLIYAALICLFSLISSRRAFGFIDSFDLPANKVFRTLRSWYRTHPIIFIWSLIFLCWLPYLIICYPGTTDPNDTLDQLKQFHGIMTPSAKNVQLIDPTVLLNNGHPVLHTILVNGSIAFGDHVLNSQNAGMFLYVLGQTLAFTAALSCLMQALRKLRFPRFLWVMVLLGFCFIPLFPAWSICVTKDAAFTAATTLYLVFLIQGVQNPSRCSERKTWLIGFFAITLLVMLLRNNGLHMVALSAPLFFFVKEVGAKRIAACAGAAILLFLMIVTVLFPALGISPGSPREVLSIPFQQTARYVYYHGDGVTDEEREAIGNVLAYDELAERYDSPLSDDVKDTFNKDASHQQMSAYFATWFEMGLKHPVLYFEATVLNCYSYFYPGSDTSWVWLQLNSWDASGTLIDINYKYVEAGYHLSQNTAFHDARSFLSESYLLFKQTPFSLPVNMGLCAWAILFCATVFWKEKAYRLLIPCAPFLVLLLVCIASPHNGNIRYALPFIVATPGLLGLVISYLQGNFCIDKVVSAPHD